MGDRAAGFAAADHDRAAGGAADRPRRHHRLRDGDGRRGARRLDHEGHALRRFAGRLRRHRRDRLRRRAARQGDGGDAAPPAGLAPGGARMSAVLPDDLCANSPKPLLSFRRDNDKTGWERNMADMDLARRLVSRRALMRMMAAAGSGPALASLGADRVFAAEPEFPVADPKYQRFYTG